MSPCFCQFNPPSSTPISNFIKNSPHLSLLETKCTAMKDLYQIHAHLIKTGLAKHPVAASRLLAFSSTSPARDLNYAYQLFTQIEDPNLFTWNTIIRGFSESSAPQIAIALFIEMLVDSRVQPHRLTYPSVFKAYSRMGLAKDGAQLFGRIVKLGLEFDPFVRNTAIHMFANCGFLEEAWKLFDEDESVDVVAWNSTIIGLGKCGEVDDARKLFDKMPVRNEVSWNSMISCYVRNGEWGEALKLFGEMQERNVMPNEFTLVSLLNACASLGALEQGEWIHEYIEKNRIEKNVIVVTAIIDMYCKCGCVEKGWRVFETTRRKGLSCWNSMILGLALNGFEDEAIELFSKLESSDHRPDHVSFIGVLTACNHSGLVDEAKYYFDLMRETYDIVPSIEHYGCMVDILGRARLLDEAKELITRSMPMKADEVIWASLLSACRSHGNIEMGEWAAKQLLDLNPSESCGHVLMSGAYASSRHLEEAIQERNSMNAKQIEKQPGCSSIEVNGEVHEFLAGGMLHPQVHDIH